MNVVIILKFNIVYWFDMIMKHSYHIKNLKGFLFSFSISNFQKNIK